MVNLKGSIIGKWNKNKYEVIQRIGQGGVGTVYEVCDRNGNRWALKISENANSITREFNIMKEFDELEGVPKVLEIDDYEHGKKVFYFFVMEFIEGMNLKEYLKKVSLKPKEMVGVSLIILNTIKKLMSKGYVYTDIKLENILVDRETKRIIFIDFGGVTNEDWGIREFTPAYNMISWGINRQYNHVEGTIFGLTMVLVAMISKKEFNPLYDEMIKVMQIIKQSNIGTLLKKTVLKALRFGYKDIDSYEKDLRESIIDLQQKRITSEKKDVDVVNLIFITSLSIFLIVVFLGIR